MIVRNVTVKLQSVTVIDWMITATCHMITAKTNNITKDMYIDHDDSASDNHEVECRQNDCLPPYSSSEEGGY